MQQRKVHALRRQIVRLEQRLLRLDTVSRLYARGRVGIVLGLATVLIVERLFGTAVGFSLPESFLPFPWSWLHNRLKTGMVRYTIWRRLR